MTVLGLRKLAALLLALLAIGCATEEEMAATREALEARFGPRGDG